MSEAFKEKISIRATSWPAPQDYSEAVQNPKLNFRDSELANTSPVLDTLGLPRVASGMFASVYCLEKEKQRWAVRCFLTNNPTTRERYANISSALSEAKLDCMLGFDLQNEGLRIHGCWYPILKMEWCNGVSLNGWLQKHLDDKAALCSFLKNWKNLIKDLQDQGIAHGDLQHGNILIDGEMIKLVDYDGMFVPALRGQEGLEIGHRNYQHPGRDHTTFGAYLDNFSAWLIYLSVNMLTLDPSLWQRFNGGDECILFRAADLIAPLESELFYELQSHPLEDVRNSSWKIRYLLSLAIDELPPLDTDFELRLEFCKKDSTRRTTPFGLPEVSPGIKRDYKRNVDQAIPVEPSSTKHSVRRKAKPQQPAIGSIFALSLFVILSLAGTTAVNFLSNPPAQVKDIERASRSSLSPSMQVALEERLRDGIKLEGISGKFKEAQDQYLYVIACCTGCTLTPQQQAIKRAAEEGLNRLWFRQQLADPYEYISASKRKDRYSEWLFNIHQKFLDKKYDEASNGCSRLINEMLADKEVYLITQQMVTLSIAYQQLGQIQEERKDYSRALNAYLNAVHVDRDIFGTVGVPMSMKNCLKVCQNAELAGNLGFAESTYKRLIELTESNPSYNKIHEQAKTGYARVKKAVSKKG